MESSKSNSKREIYSNTGLPQETRKISNEKSNLHLNEVRKKNKQNPKLVEKRNNKDQNSNKGNKDEENSRKD